MLIDTLKEINEGRAESGRGSKAGREKFASKEGTQGRSVKAKKSRVKVYDTIKDALNSGASYGTIFSTKAADRLYVISKPTWGAKSRSGGNTRIAKGFTPGSATPNATWPSIKSHAVRTMIKHGKTKAGRLNKKYGPGNDPGEGKPKKKIKEANYPKKSKKLAEILPLLTLIKRKLMEDSLLLGESGLQRKIRLARSLAGTPEGEEAARARDIAAQDGIRRAKVSGVEPTGVRTALRRAGLPPAPEKEPWSKTKAGRTALRRAGLPPAPEKEPWSKTKAVGKVVKGSGKVVKGSGKVVGGVASIAHNASRLAVDTTRFLADKGKKRVLNPLRNTIPGWHGKLQR